MTGPCLARRDRVGGARCSSWACTAAAAARPLAATTSTTLPRDIDRQLARRHRRRHRPRLRRRPRRPRRRPPMPAPLSRAVAARHLITRPRAAGRVLGRISRHIPDHWKRVGPRALRAGRRHNVAVITMDSNRFDYHANGPNPACSSSSVTIRPRDRHPVRLRRPTTAHHRTVGRGRPTPSVG